MCRPDGGKGHPVCEHTWESGREGRREGGGWEGGSEGGRKSMHLILRVSFPFFILLLLVVGILYEFNDDVFARLYLKHFQHKADEV